VLSLGNQLRETVAILRGILKMQVPPKAQVLTDIPNAVRVVTPLAGDHSEKRTWQASSPPNDSSLRSLSAEF